MKDFEYKPDPDANGVRPAYPFLRHDMDQRYDAGAFSLVLPIGYTVIHHDDPNDDGAYDWYAAPAEEVESGAPLTWDGPNHLVLESGCITFNEENVPEVAFEALRRDLYERISDEDKADLRRTVNDMIVPVYETLSAEEERELRWADQFVPGDGLPVIVAYQESALNKGDRIVLLVPTAPGLCRRLAINVSAGVSRVQSGSHWTWGTSLAESIKRGAHAPTELELRFSRFQEGVAPYDELKELVHGLAEALSRGREMAVDTAVLRRAARGDDEQLSKPTAADYAEAVAEEVADYDRMVIEPYRQKVAAVLDAQERLGVSAVDLAPLRELAKFPMLESARAVQGAETSEPVADASKGDYSAWWEPFPSDREPYYSGFNGKMDAAAAGWLLQGNHVLLDEGVFEWDGARHAVGDARFDDGHAGQVPVFASRAENHTAAFADLLRFLEGDEGLRVPSPLVHESLSPALHGGDLTGATLFALQGWSRALVVTEAGPHAYAVVVDPRISGALPDFPGLTARLIWDMRAYNGIAGPFTVSFIKIRNGEADGRFSESVLLDGPVPGARWVSALRVDDIPTVVLPDYDESDRLPVAEGRFAQAGQPEDTPAKANPELAPEDTDTSASDNDLNQRVEAAMERHRRVAAEYERGKQREKFPQFEPLTPSAFVCDLLYKEGGGLTADQIGRKLRESWPREWRIKEDTNDEFQLDVDHLLLGMVSPSSVATKKQLRKASAAELDRQAVLRKEGDKYYLWCQDGFDWGSKYERVASLYLNARRATDEIRALEKGLEGAKQKLALVKARADRCGMFQRKERQGLEEEAREISRQVEQLEAKLRACRASQDKVDAYREQCEAYRRTCPSVEQEA